MGCSRTDSPEFRVWERDLGHILAGQVGSAGPGSTRELPFGLRRCSKMRAFGEETKGVRKSSGEASWKIQNQGTPHVSMAPGPRWEEK